LTTLPDETVSVLVMELAQPGRVEAIAMLKAPLNRWRRVKTESTDSLSKRNLDHGNGQTVRTEHAPALQTESSAA
jgi:hypothetical protein